MTASTQDQLYRRIFLLATSLLATAALALGRLAYLQLEKPPASSADTSELRKDFLPERGNIYDCQGHLLAVATTVYDIGATPRLVEDAYVLADRLAPLLDEPRERLLSLLQQQDSAYVCLKRGVSVEVAKRIMDWDEDGLQADPRPGRVYPYGMLAASVLGFVTDEGQASYGLESYYDEILAGEKGFRLAERDPFGSLSYQFRAPRDGADLFLTLDGNTQCIVEEALARAVVANKAKKGIAIVMDPTSGAILAMAVYPTYDPNTRDVADQSLFINSAISEHYEPGSVFKIITIASALDAGVISPSSTYYDGGQIVVGGRIIKNSNGAAYGTTSIADLLAYSLNVGAAYVNMKLGAFKFYEYVRRFGFGQLTGIDLAYEVAGWVRVPGDREWHESDLGTNSFGQGLAVTPLQMLCAISAVANGGVLMRPYIVARIVEGTKVTERQPQVVRRVISSETAAQITEMLVYAVDKVLTLAAVPGYRVAGKSGTAQIPTPGGYDPKDTIASFAGYVPADDPRFAILVVLDRPQQEKWGIRAAAPVFQEIAQQLLTLFAVPPDNIRVSMHVQ